MTRLPLVLPLGTQIGPPLGVFSGECPVGAFWLPKKIPKLQGSKMARKLKPDFFLGGKSMSRSKPNKGYFQSSDKQVHHSKSHCEGYHACLQNHEKKKKYLCSFLQEVFEG